MFQAELLLKKFGLSEREAEVYLALLKLGSTTGYQLATKTKLNKSTVYFVLEELRKKGLVLKSPAPTKQLFTARDPGEFLREKKNSIQAFEELLPKLKALDPNTDKPNILYFDGEDSQRNALMYLLDHAREKVMHGFLTYSPEGIEPQRIALANEFVSEIGRRQIRLQTIIPKHESVGVYHQAIQKIDGNAQMLFIQRSIPISVYSPVMVKYIIGDLVLLISRRKQQSIIIQNSDIANAERQNFHMIWEYAGLLEKEKAGHR